jgi:hypothetical protein
MRAGEGYATGFFHRNRTDITAKAWIERWRAEGWDTTDILVNLGANDSGNCGTNVQCARDAIDYVLDVIGPGHRVWWPMITRIPIGEPLAEQNNWNLALQQIADERDDVWTWDWPTVMATEGYTSSDGIHLTFPGYVKRSERIAAQMADDLARAERVGADPPLPAAAGQPTEYVALEPTRVADTRTPPTPDAVGAGATLTVPLSGAVPEGTTAVAVNLTAAGPSASGYLTAHACDRGRPDASSVNFGAGQTRAAMAVIPLSSTGDLCVFTSEASHLLVDLQGAFVSAGGTQGAADAVTGEASANPSGRFTPSEPSRVADTRASGRVEVLDVAAPTGADAVAVNLTAVGADAPGFLTAYPCGERPDVSNVNFGTGEAVAGSAYVPVGVGGTICVYASTSVDVLVDMTGTFATDGDLRFVAAAPTRMIDTRDDTSGWAPVHGREQVIDAVVAPPGAAAVTGTITLAGPGRDGFATADGCGAPPDTSSVNAGAGSAMANGLTVGISADGRLCVTVSTVAQTLFDTTGWWVPAPQDLPMSFTGDRVGDVPQNVPNSQKVYMIADSVGLGTKGFFHEAFPADWQAVVDGTPAMMIEQLEARYVWGAPQSLIGDHVVVAGGYNYPHWDPDRFDRSIDSIIAAFMARGAKHVYWLTLREVKPQYISPGAWNQIQPYSWYFPTVNRHLERAIERHPNLTLVDWAANADRTGLTYDAIHLNPTGARLFSALVREKVDSVIQRAPAGSELRIEIPDTPGLATADTAAVSLNLTTTLPRTAGYLTAYPCGDEPPEVSNHNHRRDQTLAAAAIVPVATEGPHAGTVCVYTRTDSNVVVDITGRFPVDAGLVPTEPRRLVDTRASAQGVLHPAGVPLRVPVEGLPGVATDAAAVAVNVTAVGAASPGFVTVSPCGAPVPPTSNVNYGTGSPTPNLVVVEPGAAGEICVVASSDTDLVVDLFASFAADADLGLVTPERFFDSRTGPNALGADTTVPIAVTTATGIPADASGVMLNVTAATPGAAGYLSVFPCAAGLPDASNLNMVAGADVANFVLVEPDADGDVCVYTSASTHVIVDVLGFTGATFTGTSPQRLLDTRAG